jgi:hypothetical protein
MNDFDTTRFLVMDRQRDLRDQAQRDRLARTSRRARRRAAARAQEAPAAVALPVTRTPLPQEQPSAA